MSSSAQNVVEQATEESSSSLQSTPTLPSAEAEVVGAADFVVYTDSPIRKIAFGSCHKNKYADPRIWQTIAAETPEAFLWTGDAVYPPVRDIASIPQLEHEFNRMVLLDADDDDESIGYAAFVRSTGGTIFGTWDDHDYGGNDRGADMPDRAARAALYWHAFLNRTAPPNRTGIYYSVEWRAQHESNDTTTTTTTKHQPTVKVIFLDTRWHRQPQCIPSVAGAFPLGAGIACLTRWLTAGLLPAYCNRRIPQHALLGKEQWEWLEQHLLPVHSSSPPAVLLVVSSIQVLTTNPAMESWGQFPAERERLIRLLLQASDSTVVTVLSGDVHHGEILDPFPDNRKHTDTAASFLEVTSSGLTHDCSKHIYGVVCRPLLELFHGHRYQKPRDEDQRPNYYIGRNYGTVTIDWEAATVEVRVHEVVNGTTVLSTGARSFSSPSSSSWTDDDIQSILPCMNGHLIPFVWTVVLALVVAAVVGNRRIRRRLGRRRQKV